MQHPNVFGKVGRRVVVTGLGAVTPLGVGAEISWRRLLQGKSGVRALTAEDLNIPGSIPGDVLLSKIPSKVVARVPTKEFNDCPWVPEAARHISPFISFALTAAAEAIEDSKLCVNEAFQEGEGSRSRVSTGVAIGVGMSGTSELIQAGASLAAGEVRKLSPFMIPRLLPNMASGAVSEKFGFQGPLLCPSTACASGASAIGDAFRVVQSGVAPVMVCGGAESAVDAAAFGGFSRLRALSTRFNSTPLDASRPFDKDRDGFVIGEGAGVLVLEDLEHAQQRGANVYAEVVGYGCSGDAHHFTQPPPDGSGAELAMRRALSEAGVSDRLHEVSYVNAHATSTPLGDAAEQSAIAAVFGKLATTRSESSLAVSSTKGSTGHLLGAAGGVEAIFAIMALVQSIVPPTLNLQDPDQRILGNIVREYPLTRESGCVVLSNSFGFGGVNVSLAFKEFR